MRMLSVGDTQICVCSFLGSKVRGHDELGMDGLKNCDLKYYASAPWKEWGWSACPRILPDKGGEVERPKIAQSEAGLLCEVLVWYLHYRQGARKGV
jgi:hypothetical protein